MSKFKLSSISVTALLLIVVIGVISYGCTASKDLKNSGATLGKNNNQTTDLPKDNGSSMSDLSSASNHSQLDINGTTANTDNDIPLALDIEQRTQLNSANNSHARLRPEIKRILQAKFSDEAELQTALKGASILQDYLDQPNQDAVAMIKRYDCSVISLTQADQNLIQSLTFDTQERKSKIKNGLKDYKPAVSIEIAIDNEGNAVSPCSTIN